MAILREDPCRSFNFRVSIEGAENEGALAGFCAVSGLSAEIDAVEYRDGNENSTSPRKLTGLTRYGEVTLKRGVIGSTDLWDWFRTTREGEAERRTVTVELLSEDRSETVMVWKLQGCLPVKYSGPDLRAGATEVAIEELVLAVDRLDIE